MVKCDECGKSYNKAKSTADTFPESYCSQDCEELSGESY